MKLSEGKEIKREGLYSKKYISDTPFNVDSIISLLKEYEKKGNKLFECKCGTFSESGNTVEYRYKDIDGLNDIKNYVNPSVRINAIFVDPNDMSYRFTISTANNTNSFSISINDDTVNYIKRTIELDEMEKEAEKKSQENQMNNDNTYQL